MQIIPRLQALPGTVSTTLTRPADSGSDNGAREMDFQLATRNGTFLRYVEEALERIVQGDYGDCADCEKPIPEERLLEVPITTKCVPCKEKDEN